ncbi:MAG: endonuclease Q family protein [bacterium]
MEFVADFHIHSKYSRATSRDMEIPALARWAKLKGVDLLGTGDFTHHLWLQELKKYLQPQGKSGLFSYQSTQFILSAEISSIFSQDGKSYRVHNILLAPSFEVVDEINKMFSSYGNIASDGRPILGMSCKKIAEEVFRISQEVMLIPAHIWTPWLSLFGYSSGFNSLEDAYGEYTGKITALETGLSSDPAMNWMISKLDKYSLVSNSDSHSPSRIGREANVFNCQLDYWEIKKVLEQKDPNKFLYTVEFFPEEGRYHYDGHRNCNLRWHPKETKSHNGRCSVCGRAVTRGVLARVEELADRPEGFIPSGAIGYKSLVPLDEIIAETKGVKKGAKQVVNEYMNLVNSFGSEFNLLVKMSQREIDSSLPEKVAVGIRKVREKKLQILPGYDGEYGTIKIFGQEEEKPEKQQLTLF